MTCTRERKERFILSFGKINGQTGNDAVSNVMRDYGLEIFPEWAIDIMVEDCITAAREGTRRNIESRKIYASRQSEQRSAAA